MDRTISIMLTVALVAVLLTAFSTNAFSRGTKNVGKVSEMDITLNDDPTPYRLQVLDPDACPCDDKKEEKAYRIKEELYTPGKAWEEDAGYLIGYRDGSKSKTATDEIILSEGTDAFQFSESDLDVLKENLDASANLGKTFKVLEMKMEFVKFNPDSELRQLCPDKSCDNFKEFVDEVLMSNKGTPIEYCKTPADICKQEYNEAVLLADED